ncbi:MAG: hypothetical protein NTX50_16280 [Candidatus Sumerlaeota bacterium]|nr:hypothetical protein [Candidatus Sumerlaeota bacterium]
MMGVAVPMVGVPAVPRRWRRRLLRVAVILVMIGAVLLGALYVAIWLHRDPVYYGPLGALVPDNPSAVIEVNHLTSTIVRLEQSRVLKEVENNIDLAAYLLTDDDWRQYVQEANSAGIQAKLAIGRAFLKRYFGQEAMIGFFPCAARPERPGFLALTRADIGFMEETAQLAAAYYPDLRMKTKRYRGVRMYLYDAPKAKHGFAFIRLGNAVVLSLRTADSAYLKEVINRFREQRLEAGERKGERGEGKGETGGKARNSELGTRNAEAAASARIAPAQALRDYLALFPEKAELEYSPLRRIYLQRESTRYAMLEAELRSGAIVSLEARLRYTASGRAAMNAMFPPVDANTTAHIELPAETALMISASSPDPSAALAYFYDLWTQYPPPLPHSDKEAREQAKARERSERNAKALADWWYLFQAPFGFDFGRDAMPHFGGDLTVAIMGIKPGLIGPIPEIHVMAPATPSTKLQALLKSAAPSSNSAISSATAGKTLFETPQGAIMRAQTLLGPAEFETRGTSFLASLGAGVPETCAATARKERPSITESPEWKRLETPESSRHAALLVYANFPSLRKALAALIESVSFWDKDTRQTWSRARSLIGALSGLKAASLTVTPTTDSLTARLRFPLD